MDLKGGEKMIKVLRWIVLVWTVIAIPYLFNTDGITIFFSLLYVGLIIGLMIRDLRGKK